MRDRPEVQIWFYAAAFMGFVIAALLGVTTGMLWTHMPLI
jgi:hypothetical protein